MDQQQDRIDTADIFSAAAAWADACMAKDPKAEATAVAIYTALVVSPSRGNPLTEIVIKRLLTAVRDEA